MHARVNNFMIDFFWLHLLLCSAIYTVNIDYIKPFFYSSNMPTGMIKYKYEINTRMRSLKDVGTVLKLQENYTISPIYLGTCTILKILAEMISPHGDGLIVSISQDGSCCICINIFRVESVILINGLEIWNGY